MSKKRLGRGLSGMLSGGVKKSAAKESIAPTKKSSKKSAAKPKAEKKESPKSTQPDAAKGYLDISIDKVEPSPWQARKEFNEEGLAELAESIRSEGLMQPITVRAVDGKYELIAGERRWRACVKLGLKTVAAHVVTASDASSAVMSLIENLQRRDLNPIEEALGYVSLMDDFKLTQEDVAERVGKARSTVANSLRLLQLSKECQGYLAKGMLSFGHAKALLSIEDKDQQALVARRIIESQMSVREAERIAAGMKTEPAKMSKAKPVADSEIAVIQKLESNLSTELNTRVQLKHTPKKGKMIIEYFGNDDLQRILEKLGLQ